MELGNLGAVLTLPRRAGGGNRQFYMTALDNSAIAEYRDAHRGTGRSLKKERKGPAARPAGKPYRDDSRAYLRFQLRIIFFQIAHSL